MAKSKSNFSAFSKKLKDADEALGKGRKGRKGFIELEPGKYVVRAQSLEFGSNDKGPFTKLTTVCVDVVDGDEDSVGLKAADFISFKEMKGKSKKSGEPYHITEADHFANLCTAIQSLGTDTSELEMSDLEKIAEMLAEDQPACMITVVEKNGYMNIKWGKFVEDDELPTIDDVLEDDEEEDDDDVEESDEEDEEEEESEDDSDDEEDDEDEDEDEEDEEELDPVVKGEVVRAKPEKTKKVAKYKVKSSNKKNETCTLIRESDDKEFKNESWDVVVR